MIVSRGTIIIHSVNARNGIKQMKKLITTAPSIKITCLRYFSTLDRFPCDVMLGLFIKWRAITVYNTSSIPNGNMKNVTIQPTKKNICQYVSTGVSQIDTVDPSKYCVVVNCAIHSMGLNQEKNSCNEKNRTFEISMEIDLVLHVFLIVCLIFGFFFVVV